MRPTVGVDGATVSMMRATVPVAVFPARSVMVIVGLFPMSDPVPVQVMTPPVDGDGVQVVFGIETVAPLSTRPVVIVTSVVAVAGFGEAVVVGRDGTVSSRVRSGV